MIVPSVFRVKRLPWKPLSSPPASHADHEKQLAFAGFSHYTSISTDERRRNHELPACKKRPGHRHIRADGCFVYPGLINTHNHLYQTFTRNLPQVQKMELFPWLITLYEIWKGLDEDCIFYSSLTGLGELLRNGCTTAMDHHYVFPRVGSEHFIDRQFEAADLLGIRFHATRGSMSLGKSDGGLPPDELVQPVDVILKDSRRLVEKYHDPKPFAMHQVSLAPCSPFSVSEDLLVESAALARSLGVRLHTHLCETKDEEHFTLSKVGMRPLAYMEKRWACVRLPIWKNADGSARTYGMPTGFISTMTSCVFLPIPEPALHTARCRT